jgi:hypothetical protein
MDLFRVHSVGAEDNELNVALSLPAGEGGTPDGPRHARVGLWVDTLERRRSLLDDRTVKTRVLKSEFSEPL